VTDLLYLAALLVASPFFAIRRLGGAKAMDWRGRRGFGPALLDDPRPTILLHGVSVGEVAALQSVVEHLAASGRCRVVISSTTDTGIATAARLYSDLSPVVRYPLDLTPFVRRFLRRTNPAVVVLAELEIWPNFVRECRRRGTPVIVVNGRISEGNHRASRWAGPLLRGAFQSLDLVLAQSAEDAARFRSLGTPGPQVETENALKWDAASFGEDRARDEELGQALGVDPARPVLLAISTGPGEEARLIQGLDGGVQLILAPRHPERFDEVAALVPGAPRRSDAPDGTVRPAGRRDVYLLDSIGEIDRALTLADIAVMGRSICESGGSNPIQPVAAGVPTVTGPGFENFRDIVEVLEAEDGIRVSPDPMSAVRSLLADPGACAEVARRGLMVVRERRGSGARTADRLLGLLGG